MLRAGMALNRDRRRRAQFWTLLKKYEEGVQKRSWGAPIPPEGGARLAMNNHHGPDEVRRRLEALTDEDWERFRRVARYQLFRFAQLDPEDLVQDVALRFLDMKRKWPRGEDFKAVFYNAIRSVADDYRDAEMSKPHMAEADLVAAPDGSPARLDDMARDDRTPEKALEAGQLVEQAFAAFKGDQDAEAVIMGRMTESSAEEVQAEFGMTVNEYHAARKRFERWLSRQNHE
jgi:DNA-directed RNA polymerase specialized sigma24 family protein